MKNDPGSGNKMKARKRQRFAAILLTVFIVITGMAGCGGGGGGDGTTPLSDAKAITGFSFTNPAATGTIDENAKTIAVTVPNGTHVTQLVATFTTTGESVKVGGRVQVSGTTANNFTSPVEYIITAADGTTATYTVTVTVTPSPEKAITAFSFISPDTTGTIDENAKTIAVTVPNGTDVTALVATFTTTGASVKVGGTVQVSGTTANNFTSPVTYTVTAADGTTAIYTVTVTVALSPEKAITAFSFTSPPTTGTIDENAKTIAVTVPNGTDVTALVATFTTTGASVKVGSTVQVSGTTANNFTSPVTYTVTAADSTTATYIVIVLESAAATSAVKLSQTGQTICSDGTGTVITCADTGQDGELQKGVAWPSPRFTNADNSTPISGSVVVDQLTGLIWTKDGNAPGPAECTPAILKTWQGALDYVACLILQRNIIVDKHHAIVYYRFC